MKPRYRFAASWPCTTRRTANCPHVRPLRSGIPVRACGARGVAVQTRLLRGLTCGQPARVRLDRRIVGSASACRAWARQDRRKPCGYCEPDAGETRFPQRLTSPRSARRQPTPSTALREHARRTGGPAHGGSAATLDTPATWSRSGVRLSALTSAPAGKVESGFVARPPSRGVGSTWERATRRLAWRPEERREQDTSARAPPRLPVAGPRSSRPGPCLRLP